MSVYILDENIAATVPLWNNEKFIHVLEISDNFSDGNIWQYAIDNNLIIITKDADFYNRYLSSSESPKLFGLEQEILRKKLFINSLNKYGLR